MENNSIGTPPLDRTDETSLIGGEFTSEEYEDMCEDLQGRVAQYVQSNPHSTNTHLFSFLALLNTYAPESYLLMSECQKILGPPDPIYGGPPFEDRMEPFTDFISVSSPPSTHVYIHPVFAEDALELIADSGFSRSTTVKKLMSSLCGEEPQPDTVEFIKEILTKRKMGEKGREPFSPLIQDICDRENLYNAVSVLKTASGQMKQHPMFPQALSRFYYVKSDITNYAKAETWAKTAIERAPNNSFVADTLGQVYKNCLMRTAWSPEEISHMARAARTAFQEVERKADNEEGPEMMDEAGVKYISSTFNNRGLFGFIQVAKIALEKLRRVYDPQQTHRRLVQKLRMQVDARFNFFEWYLTYSQPNKTSLEPSYFWKDVAVCYELYTGQDAADSISFPGLLELLNRGLFTSRGRRSGIEEAPETVSDLEEICDDLRTTYEDNVDDDKDAERYILSNIILSNKAPNSSTLTPLTELQSILSRFLVTEERHRSPEFYLLVLLLFWPQEHPQVVQEEEREVHFGPDLERHVQYMEPAFERAGYTKYLRGRYLVPLFFLGKGSGLSKWIHKSKLDAIVETAVNAVLAGRVAAASNSQHEKTKIKWKLINEQWSTGQVWQIPDIRDILLPVKIEPIHSPTIPQEQEDNKVFVCAGGRRILATTEFEPGASAPTPFYLGFTIEGPVVFQSHVQSVMDE